MLGCLCACEVKLLHSLTGIHALSKFPHKRLTELLIELLGCTFHSPSDYSGCQKLPILQMKAQTISFFRYLYHTLQSVA